jgi:diadenosine tetraphosphatase ApaH/serine/threonine PP2A family protein phosphatase
MTGLVISDIHANLEALDTVLEAAGEYDHVLILGDLVGYGANPNEVIDRVRALPVTTCIRGNHDKAAIDFASTEHFNHLARFAIQWTADQLTPASRDWLAALPSGPLAIDPLVEICHGAPFDEDAYIFDDLDVRRAMAAANRPVCLFGHTHVPAAFKLADEPHHIGPPRTDRFKIHLEPASRYLVNCGAVGQPRDGDPRAAYALLDTTARTLTILRVPYDVKAAQNKIIAAGLPEVLAHRLALGR